MLRGDRWDIPILHTIQKRTSRLGQVLLVPVLVLHPVRQVSKQKRRWVTHVALAGSVVRKLGSSGHPHLQHQPEILQKILAAAWTQLVEGDAHPRIHPIRCHNLSQSPMLI